MDRIKTVLRILMTPKCWARNYLTHKKWDKALREQLLNPVFTEISEHSVKLNGVEIWVANYPYAYGSQYSSRTREKYLPSRATVFLLHDMLPEPPPEPKWTEPEWDTPDPRILQ